MGAMAGYTQSKSKSYHRFAGSSARRSFEAIACLIVLIGFTIILAQIRIEESFWGRLGDTLIFEQIIDSIAHGHGAISSIFASTQKLIDSGALTMERDDYFKVVLSFDPAVPRDMLKFHAYFVLYLFAWLCRFLNSHYILSYVQILCFTVMAMEAYVWLRYRGVAVTGALAFTCLIVCHPAWGVSIDGQFYPDRLFLPLGFAVFAAIHDGWRLRWSVPLVLLTLSVNERASTVLGLFFIAHGICFVTWPSLRPSITKVVIGFGLLGLGSYLQSHVLENLYYASFMPGSWDDLMARLSSIAFRDGLLSFLMVNAGLFLLSLMNWRASLIATGLMLPNMLGSVGGAEKTVFLTHYHSYYFPALVWAAGLGLHRLTTTLPLLGMHRALPRFFLAAAPVLVCGVAGLTDLVDWAIPGRVALSWKTFANSNALMGLSANWKTSFGPEGAELRHERDQAIALAAPGRRISAQQSAMWAAPADADLAVYPFGIQTATDLMVICHAKPDGSWDWTAVESFLSPADRQSIEQGFRDRARQLGFDVDRPMCSSPPFQIGVISRVPRP